MEVRLFRKGSYAIELRNRRTKPTLIVMAAGLGSRYGELKPLAPVGPNGEASVAYSIYDALKAGFGSIVFVIRKGMEAAFRERVGKSVEEKTETVYVFQELDRLPRGFRVPPGREKPWGTAHAILCCKEAVAAPFAVINADDFYGRTSYEVLAGWLKGAAGEDRVPSYCMAGFLLKNTLSPHGAVSRGICRVTADGFLDRITERTRIRLKPSDCRQRTGDSIQYADEEGGWVEISGATIVSMNMWGLTPAIFSELERRFAAFLESPGESRRPGQSPTQEIVPSSDVPSSRAGAQPPLEGAEFYLPTVIGELVHEGLATVRVLRTGEAWFGLTYPEDLPGVQRAVLEMIRRGTYPERLWE